MKCHRSFVNFSCSYFSKCCLIAVIAFAALFSISFDNNGVRCDIILKKRWAFLNMSASNSVNTQFKNLFISDSAIYGFNSPSHIVSAKLIAVECLSPVYDAANASSNAPLSSLSTSTPSAFALSKNMNGCSKYRNANLPENFIALVRRGECSFEKKISVAVENKASAIIIQNTDEEIFTMLIRNDSIVSLMVSNYVGNLLLTWMTDVDTYVTISPGVVELVESNSLPAKASIFFVCITFLLVIIISMVWIVIYFVQKYQYLNAKKRLEKKLKKATMKAMSKLNVRKLKSDDREIGDSCAICLDIFIPGDQVRELPCNHCFHQTKCIDLWLLDHRSCPMCKIDILEACGIEVKRSRTLFDVCMDRCRFLFRNSNVEDIMANNRVSILGASDQQRHLSSFNTKTGAQLQTQTSHVLIKRELPAAIESDLAINSISADSDSSNSVSCNSDFVAINVDEDGANVAMEPTREISQNVTKANKAETNTLSEPIPNEAISNKQNKKSDDSSAAIKNSNLESNI